MRATRFLVIGGLLLSLGLIFASALLFEDAWSWYPWRAPAAFRDRMQLPWQEGGSASLSAVLAEWFGRLLIGSILIYLFPKRVRLLRDAASRGARSILWNGLLGLLGTACVAGVMLAAVFSAHTFPLAMVLGLAYVTLSQLGVTALNFWLGRELTQRAGWHGASPLASLWAGTTVIFALTRVPFLGVVAFGVLWAVASGLVISTRFGSGAPWTLAPLLMEDDKT